MLKKLWLLVCFSLLGIFLTSCSGKVSIHDWYVVDSKSISYPLTLSTPIIHEIDTHQDFMKYFDEENYRYIDEDFFKEFKILVFYLELDCFEDVYIYDLYLEHNKLFISVGIDSGGYFSGAVSQVYAYYIGIRQSLLNRVNENVYLEIFNPRTMEKGSKYC